MYNEALVNALNADRQRGYDDLERMRRQREITASRVAEAAEPSDATNGRTTRARRHGMALRHAAAR